MVDKAEDMSANYLRRCSAIMIDELDKMVAREGKDRRYEVMQLMKIYLEAPAFAPYRRTLLDRATEHLEKVCRK